MNTRRRPRVLGRRCFFYGWGLRRTSDVIALLATGVLAVEYRSVAQQLPIFVFGGYWVLPIPSKNKYRSQFLATDILLRKEGDSNPRYSNPVRQFSKLVV